MRRVLSQRRGLRSSVALYGVLIGYSLICLFPFIWLALSSLKSNEEIYRGLIGLPSQLRFENYVTALETADIPHFMLNSVIVSVAAVILVLLIGSMAAYVLARVVPNGLVFTFFAIGIMIPVQTILIPTFVLMRALHLTNTLTALVVLYAATMLPLAVVILVGFMRALPRELEEAAALDGAGRTSIFFRVILPLSRPGLAAVGTLSFLYCWNEYLFAYVLNSQPAVKTLPQGIYNLQGMYTAEYGPLTAALVLSIVPVLIAYVLFQEQVIEGATAGAVVG